MKTAKTLVSEIHNKMYNSIQDPKKSPEFLKWLHDLLHNHSLDVIRACIKIADEAEYKNDIEEEINKLKKQF